MRMRVLTHVRPFNPRKLAAVAVPIAAFLSVSAVPQASAHATPAASQPALVGYNVGQSTVWLPRGQIRSTTPVLITPRSGSRSPLTAGLSPTAGQRLDADAGYGIPPAPPATPSKGSPFLKSVGETLQTAGNGVMAIGTAGVIANLYATATGVAAPVGVPGLAVSGGIFAGGLALSFVGSLLKNYNSDPVDFNFRKIAVPASVTLNHLTSKNKKAQRIYDAQEKLLGTVVEGLEVSRAFTKSVDRAHGAIARGNAHWRKLQLAAAVKYAHQGAVLFGELPALQRADRNAIAATKVGLTINEHKLHRFTGLIDSSKAKRFIKNELDRIGLPNELSFVDSLFKNAKPAGYGLKFPGTLVDPTLIAEEQKAATDLAAYNDASILKLIAAASH
jgi:hypothetical protein